MTIPKKRRPGRPAAKRKLVKLVAYVDPGVLASAKAEAERVGLPSVSALVSQILSEKLGGKGAKGPRRMSFEQALRWTMEEHAETFRKLAE